MFLWTIWVCVFSLIMGWNVTWTCGHVNHPSMALLPVMGEDMWQPRPHTELFRPLRDSHPYSQTHSLNSEYIQYFKCNTAWTVSSQLSCMCPRATTVSHPKTFLQDLSLFILLANPILTPFITPTLMKQKPLCQVICC